MDNLPSLNVVVFYLANRSLYRPVIFSENEVFCGPDCETEINNNKFLTIKTPQGTFDITEIINQLPQSQKPELVIVKADATRRNFPTNLKGLNCPKILIIGLTYNFIQPIQTLLDYARQEPFDCLISEHNRHHLHFFKEAGFEKICWIPAFNINPYPQLEPINPKYPLSFVGQAGRFHPYRKHILKQIKEFGLPLNQVTVPQDKTAEIYASSLINLNISLNGDLNLRVFEVLASGGFLLTDRLSPQSGLELLFQEGKHLETFRNEEELKYKIQFFLNHPESAKKIARDGCNKFWDNHSSEVKIQRILDYLDGQEIEPLYTINIDRRSTYFSKVNLEQFNLRVSIYEYFQELHLNSSNLKVLFWPQVDPKIICDVVDLPRLNVNLLIDNQENIANDSDTFGRCEITNQITFINPSTLQDNHQKWDVLALTVIELKNYGIFQLLKDFNFRQLLITDGIENLSEDDYNTLDNLLTQVGFTQTSKSPLIYIWKRKSNWGKRLLLQQEWRLAMQAFENALVDDPFDVNALLELGILSFKLMELKEAKQMLYKALSLDRRNSEILEYLARILMALNQYDEAQDILQILHLIKPDNLSVTFKLNHCYSQSDFFK